MSLLNAISVDAIRARGSITDGDVLLLRRAFYEDGAIDPAEAEVLFALNTTCPVQEPHWADCFVEMLTDYVVNQAKPEGYVTIENAEWLVSQIAKDGSVESKTELELLINVLDKARWSPQSLVAFALAQVERAVIEGTGPLRAGKSLAAGVINEAEVELLKRILYAFGGDGNIAITRPEAEILFAIDAATQGQDNRRKAGRTCSSRRSPTASCPRPDTPHLAANRLWHAKLGSSAAATSRLATW